MPQLKHCTLQLDEQGMPKPDRTTITLDPSRVGATARRQRHNLWNGLMAEVAKVAKSLIAHSERLWQLERRRTHSVARNLRRAKHNISGRYGIPDQCQNPTSASSSVDQQLTRCLVQLDEQKHICQCLNGGARAKLHHVGFPSSTTHASKQVYSQREQ